MHLRVPPPRRVSFARVGGFGDILEVPDEAMVEFSANVDMLNADISVSAQKLPAPPATLDPLQQQFALWHLTQWIPWFSSWQIWAAAHQDGLSRLPSSAGIEFGQFKSSFNIHLRTYKEFGGTTSLLPEVTDQPIPAPEEDDEPWYETVTDVITKNIMITTLLAGAGLLAYVHVTKPGR